MAQREHAATTPTRRPPAKRATRRTTRAVATHEAPASQEPAAERATQISAQQRMEMIATAAYFRAESRGFQPGSELQDWLEAEAEIDQLITE